MKNANPVSENLRGDNVRSFRATRRDRSHASNSNGKRTHIAGSQGSERSGDLRSIVAGRFMHMLRAHDRARLQVLTTHPGQAR